MPRKTKRNRIRIRQSKARHPEGVRKTNPRKRQAKPALPKKVWNQLIGSKAVDITRLDATEAVGLLRHTSALLIRGNRNSESDPLWDIAVIPGPMCKQEEWRKVYPKLYQLKRDLIRMQGSDPALVQTALKAKWKQLFDGGVSYGDLVRDANFDLQVFLHWGMDESKGAEWSTAGWKHFRDYMDVAGYGPRESKVWFEDGKESIRAGRSPWTLATGPITPDKLIAALDTFRANLQSENIVLKKLPPLNEVDRILGVAQAAGPWYDAARFLKKVDPGDFAANEDRYLVRKEEILRALFGNQT